MRYRTYCQKCFIEMSSPKSTTIEVCTCGHGKIHHDGKYGDCTCPITWKDTKCKCEEFNLSWGIWYGVKMKANEYLKSIEKH